MSINNRGGMTIWLVAMFPVLTGLLVIFIHFILLVDARITMQGAVDRGLHAGANYLAHAMNEVAELNKKFRDEYLSKEKIFVGSEQNEDLIKKHIEELNHNQGVHYEEMNEWLKDGYKRAHEIAEEVAKENLKGSPHLSFVGYKVFSGDPDEEMFQMVNDGPEGGPFINKGNLKPDEIVGEPYDPRKYTPNYFEAYEYLVKDNDDFVALASGIAAHFKSPFLPEKFLFHVIAASQPYGGSIKEYAFTGEEEFLYHPMIVPVKTVVGELDVPEQATHI